jgi:hypothetical protein
MGGVLWSLMIAPTGEDGGSDTLGQRMWQGGAHAIVVAQADGASPRALAGEMDEMADAEGTEMCSAA